jgi:hypothetical protein
MIGEKDRTEPAMCHWPAILDDLGNDRFPEPEFLGQRLQRRYRHLGLSRNVASRQLSMDEDTPRRYEDAAWTRAAPRTKRLIAQFLAR